MSGIIATTNGWEDMKEDEREAFEAWEAEDEIKNQTPVALAFSE